MGCCKNEMSVLCMVKVIMVQEGTVFYACRKRKLNPYFQGLVSTSADD